MFSGKLREMKRREVEVEVEVEKKRKEEEEKLKKVGGVVSSPGIAFM